MSFAKWKHVADAVRARIESGALPPGTPLPSETELAREYGVCRVTAHRAMAELQRQGLVVRRRRQGTFVAYPQSDRPVFVAALFPLAGDYPQVEYLRGVRCALPDQYHLLLCETHNDPHCEAQYLRRMQYEADGLLCYPTCHPKNTPLFQRVVESGKPVVCLDRQIAEVACDTVMTDNYRATLTGLQYLIATGHRRIAHITHNGFYVSSIRERYEAYVDAMCTAGWDDVQAFTRLLPMRNDTDLTYLQQAVYDALFTMTHQSEPITAVFCLHDYQMVTVLEACERMGLHVPEDLEILSFADAPLLAPRAARSVHRLVQQVREMGRIAATRLQQRIHGATMPPEVIRTQAAFYPAEHASRRALDHATLSSHSHQPREVLT
ncbi:MAG: GntR family transcriptional regulator [Chloroherpetonaceae bacterium]|nr:GntR family transcriptional regulator [Chthonomonadaceae bacterium]MDW8209418.1 GntR family transcriptional regulator [Chloroherpetonaceae bacterium]